MREEGRKISDFNIKLHDAKKNGERFIPKC